MNPPRSIVILTGAGVSAESGVATFRDRGGIWAKVDYREVATPEGRQSGLLHDSLISCNNLATVEQGRIQRVIGSLPARAMQTLDDCLRAALSL